MKSVKVWDPFVRLFHWIVVAGFLVCYITEGKPKWLHVNSGFVVATLVALRVVWGIVGPRHARFSDFVRGPRQVFRHLGEVVRLKAKRYVGHDPAGGAMIVALLLSLSLTVSSGMFLYGAKNHAGPLAGLATKWVSEGVDSATKVQSSKGLESGVESDRTLYLSTVRRIKETHETFANITLTLVILHVCGVLLVSFQTRENLVWGMISGRKNMPDDLSD